MMVLVGCAKKNVSLLDKPVKDEYNKNIINHFTKNIIDIKLAPDTEEFAMYLPKDSVTVRFDLKVSNIEDVLYIKLNDDGEFNNSRVLKRVNDINKLKQDQSGFVFEPSIKKGVVTIQLFVPVLYLSKNSYTPTLIYSYKRASKSSYSQ